MNGKTRDESRGIGPKGRDRLARILKGNRQTRTGKARPVKNFSPSRLGIKKGIFPSPTVSDGGPSTLLSAVRCGRPYSAWRAKATD